MALHLVGETINKTRNHYRAETGKLVQLMRSIYVDSGAFRSACSEPPKEFLGGPYDERIALPCG